MYQSRFFCFVAITLWLMSCFRAHAAVNRIVAYEAVKEAQELTKKVLVNARAKYLNAEDVKEAVESHKGKAERAVSQVEAAADGNAKAVAIAQAAKAAVEKNQNAYTNANHRAEKAVNYVNKLLAQAGELVTRAKSLMVPVVNPPNDYTNVKNSATAVKKEAEKLDKKITVAQKVIDYANTTLATLSNFAEKAQVAKYQVDAIVKVAKFGTLLDKADADVLCIEQKMDKVNSTVEAINDLFKNITHEVFISLCGFLYNAEGDLITISRSVGKVKEVKQDMLKHKNNAGESIALIEKETDENEAQEKLENIKYYIASAEKLLATITKELGSADIHVKNANYRKEDVLKALAKNRNTPGGKDSRSAGNPENPVENTPPKPESKSTDQTAEKQKEQLVNNTPTQTACKETDQIAAHKGDKPVENTSTQSVSKEADELPEKKKEESVDNKTKSHLKKAVLSTLDKQKDNAITLAFSLPLALMLLAALH